MQRVEDLAMQ